jgi:flagellar protein FlaG
MSLNGSNMVGNSSGLPVYSDKLPGLQTGGSQSGSVPDGQTGSTLEKQPTRKELEREVENLNKFLQSSTTHIKFTLHEELNEYYVQVINDQTNEVIREIPSKKVMDMVAKMHEMIGLLIDEKR